VGDVAVRVVLRIGLSMEGIACRVDADKSQALVNSIEQGIACLGGDIAGFLSVPTEVKSPV